MYSIANCVGSIAEMIKNAAALSLEIFEKVIGELNAINGEAKNYEPETPLTFSPAGLLEIKTLPSIGNYLGKQKNMLGVIKSLSSLVDIVANTGDENMNTLSKKLHKPGKWQSVNIEGKSIKDAQTIINNNVLEFAAEALDDIKKDLKKDDEEREKKLDVIREKLNKGEISDEEAVKQMQEIDKRLVYSPKVKKPDSALKQKLLTYGDRLKAIHKRLQNDEISDEEAAKSLEKIIDDYKSEKALAKA